MEFQLQHQASNEYSGLISLRIDWFNLLAVQGTQESSPTPQFKSINSLALSFLYSLTCSTHMTTRKTIALTPWTVAYHASLSMGFSRQEYWSGLPFPSPRDLPDLGTEPGSPTLQTDALPSEPPGRALVK